MNEKNFIQLIKRYAKAKVEVLDFSYKGLQSLPANIGDIVTLRSLSLRGNRLNELPLEIGNLENLQKLDISYNSLLSLPSEIGNLVKLERLVLSHNNLDTLPFRIGNLSSLQVLNLLQNELTLLPSDVGLLANLKRLDLSHNNLNMIPQEIGALTNLEGLDLSNNKMSFIPSQIFELVNLKRLNLNDNQLTLLPPEIRQLRKLEWLELGSNQIKILPPELGELRKLMWLRIPNNQLGNLPPQIGQLTELLELDLRYNKIDTLIPQFTQLAKLQSLQISGNKLISPPPEIVEQGIQAIWVYLRDQLQDSSKQWVSKLLVIGEGGVGKTSLLRALRNEEFNTEESTTHGIEIESLELKHPTVPDVYMQLNTWDFGGQEIYHATHQFFLTNRSLFILAWNARLGFEQGKLYYWLDTIKARAPESPVILVATFIDERDANLPLADLRRKYPQIVANCEISNKTGYGIESLHKTISSNAAKLPLMGESWPTNWLNAANAIRSQSENHIGRNQLWCIMDAQNVTQEKAHILAQWLHELGDILFFRDDPELNDTVILNPQWVTQTISQVLESEEVINNLGLFTREHMDEIWEDIDPPIRDHLLRLMEKFDLSYRTLENRDISLVVERLNLDPPNYDALWNKCKESGTCNEISMKLLETVS